MSKPRPDVFVHLNGTITLFEPVTRRAKKFFRESVASEPWQWLGGSIAVDHRMAGDLGYVLTDVEGFRVAFVPGRIAA